MHCFSKRPSGFDLGKCGLAALGFSALVGLSPSAARAQDLFVTNYGNRTVSRFAATGPGTFSTTATALSAPSLDHQPSGLAFDTSGDLFVGNYTDTGGSITEFVAGVTPGTFGATAMLNAPSLRGPSNLTLDANGDLFAANTQNNNVTEFLAGASPGTFGANTFLTDPSLNVPVGLALDVSGDLFVTNQNGNSLTKFSAGTTPGTFGATSVITGGGLSAPQGPAFDASGNLFVPNISGGPLQNGTITEFLAGAMPGTFSSPTTLTSDVSGPADLVFDTRGDLFVANNYNGTIREFPFTPGANGLPGTFGPAQTVETGLTGVISLAFGPSVLPVLVSLVVPSPVSGGTVPSATVTLSGVTPIDVVVGLSSSDSSIVRLHRSVIVPAGSASATFPINTFRSHVTQTVTIQATLGQVVKSQILTITGR